MNTSSIDTSGGTFARFMASKPGRLARVALGATLVGAGLTLVPAPAGWFVAAFGAVPIASGVLNPCPVAPLWGGHFIGANYCPTRASPGTRADRAR